MNTLQALQHFTPTGTAEGERHILNEVFVEQENFDRLIIPKPNSPIILVGKKGSGKSAILDAVAMTSLELGIPVARIKPREMKLVSADEDGSIGSLTRSAYEAMISAVAIAMAAEVKGLVSEDDAVLLDEGVRTGVLNRDFVSRLSRVLPRVAKPIIGDFPELLEGEPHSSIHRIRNVIRNKLNREAGVLYVLVDDSDQIADPSSPQHVNRIWGLMLAARDLAQLSERLRVVVTVREEVWRRLGRSGAGQRDQADHFDGLVVRLTPSEELMKKIVVQRLAAAVDYLGLPSTIDLWSPFFEGRGARIPTSDDFSGWADLIVSRARNRPRDAVQFLNRIAENAEQRGSNLIGQEDIDAVVPSFSKKRVEYLRNEAEEECPDVEKVIDSLSSIPFDQGSFKASFDVLRSAMHRMPGAGITLLGKRLRVDDDDSFLALLQFLFDYDVLNARMSDVRKKDGYRFIRPSDDLILVSKGRWADLQKIVWEVNPAFRDYLITIQENEAARRGLASKHKGRGRH